MANTNSDAWAFVESVAGKPVPDPNILLNQSDSGSMFAQNQFAIAHIADFIVPYHDTDITGSFRFLKSPEVPSPETELSAINKSYLDSKIRTVVLTPGPIGPIGPRGPQGIPGKGIVDWTTVHDAKIALLSDAIFEIKSPAGVNIVGIDSNISLEGTGLTFNGTKVITQAEIQELNKTVITALNGRVLEDVEYNDGDTVVVVDESTKKVVNTWYKYKGTWYSK